MQQQSPPWAMQAVRDRFRLTGRLNLLYAGELLEILALFDAHGIRAIPYKGPILAAEKYGSISLRTFSDLDILIPRRDVRQASGLLRQRGYICDGAPLTATQEDVTLRSAHELVHRHPETTVCVEIHWALLPRYMAVPIDLERLWQRSSETTFMGRRIRSLSPEDLLLILCVHGANHCWERLDWICGVAEVIRCHRDLDWRGVLDEADAAGCRRIFLLGVALAGYLLKADVPADVLARVRADRAVASLAAQVERRLFDPSPTQMTLVAASLFHLRARERARDRIRCVARLATTLTPRDVAVVDLPRSLRVLYHLVRPLRLLASYGARADLRRPAQRGA